MNITGLRNRLTITILTLPSLMLGAAGAHADALPATAQPTTKPAAPTTAAIGSFMTWMLSNDLKQIEAALDTAPLLANALNDMKEPPLLYASSVPAAKLLVDKGADVNILVSAPAGDYKAPLVVRVAMSQPKVLRYLASRGANLRARDTEGNTALIRAAEADQVDSVRFLLAQKLSATAKSRSGQTPLHAWALGGDPRPGAIAQMLLARGARINAQDDAGRTPLDRAAEYNNATSVRFLLLHKATASTAPKSGYSALHWAAENNSVPIAQMLLAHGAKINARDEDGQTPLAVANAHKSHLVAKYLSQHGAKI